MIDSTILNEYDVATGGLFGYSLPEYDEHTTGEHDDE